MQNITLDTITQAVMNHSDRGKSHPRLHDVYASVVHHLHDFVREVNLTEPELQQGRDFLNQASHSTQEVPVGEIHLLLIDRFTWDLRTGRTTARCPSWHREQFSRFVVSR